jgi:hypothetical protein
MGQAAAAALAGAAQSGSGPYQLFWGDMHNHNAVGYAKGSVHAALAMA